MIIGTFLVIGSVIFDQLPVEDQNHLKRILSPYWLYLFIPLVTLFVGIFIGSKWLLDQLWLPILQLCEELKIILIGNPSHRIQSHKSTVIRPLIDLINQHAESMEILKNQIRQQISKAKLELDGERQLFAMLIEELAEGVIVCNAEGIIVLYNDAVHHLLASFPDDVESHSSNKFIGLGRSIDTVIEDKVLLDYTIDELKYRHSRGDSELTQHFIMWQGTNLLKVEAVATVNLFNHISSFIFILQGILPQKEIFHPYARYQQNIKEAWRSKLTNLLVSSEILLDYPHISQQIKNNFIEIMRTSTNQLIQLMKEEPAELLQEMSSHWSLQETSVQEWLTSAAYRIENTLEMKIVLKFDEAPCSIHVNRFLMTQCLDHLFRQLKTHLFVDEGQFHLFQGDYFVLIDIVWKGKRLLPETLNEWITEPLEKTQGLTISEVLRQHEAEILFDPHMDTEDAEGHYLRFFFHKVSTNESHSSNVLHHVSLEHPPLVYDFALLRQDGGYLAPEEARLSELSYTVFDTETTGLDPGGGDEIISIGAVRIVNGRILPHDVFEQLIDPGRVIPKDSIKIHGIQPEMLDGKPVIERVLPSFQKFIGDTVLVAHNAAFDMRFLELKEQSSSIKFTNSVLDTLLLSAVVHPYHELHSLEDIAQRFNIEMEGRRHTALADAMLTAKIFLKLIPLLAEREIYTIQDAQLAAQETYYAKLKY